MLKTKNLFCILLLSLLFFSFSLPTYSNNDQQEAYEWIVQNAENSEILQRLQDEWGDDYVIIKYAYQQQVEALEWINQQPNAQQMLEEGRQEFDGDYTLVKYQYERELGAERAVTEISKLIITSFFFFHLVLFLLFVRDMYQRQENILLWFLPFIIFPPLGIILYQSSKKLKKDEKRSTSMAYNFAKNFLIFWPIYMVFTFIYLLAILLVKDSLGGQNVDAEFLGEALFWFGGLFACFVLPVIVLVPMALAGLIMFLTKEKEEKKKKK